MSRGWLEGRRPRAINEKRPATGAENTVVIAFSRRNAERPSKRNELSVWRNSNAERESSVLVDKSVNLDEDTSAMYTEV